MGLSNCLPFPNTLKIFVCEVIQLSARRDFIELATDGLDWLPGNEYLLVWLLVGPCELNLC